MTWVYIIGRGEDFAGSQELYDLYLSEGADGLEACGGSTYTIDVDEGTMTPRQVMLMAYGAAFEDGWEQYGTVSRLFREEEE